MTVDFEKWSREADIALREWQKEMEREEPRLRAEMDAAIRKWQEEMRCDGETSRQ